MDVPEDDVGRVLELRLQKLRSFPQFETRCPCGKPKGLLSVVKLDAAQFFRAADLERGVARIKQLLESHNIETYVVEVCFFQLSIFKL